MMQQPKWKEHFRVERLEPDLVFLLTQEEKHILTGDTYYKMAPLLNGANSLSDITQQLNGGSSYFDVSLAVARLQKKGYVMEASDTLPPHLAILSHELGVDTKVAKQRLLDVQIHVLALNSLDGASLVTKLEKNGLQVVADPREADLTVVLVEDYLEPELARLNEEFMHAKRPWLIVRPVGTWLKIGPLFQPDENGCWTCLSHRLQLQRRVESFLQRNIPTLEASAVSVPTSTISPLLNIGLDWSVMEIVKWVLQGHNALLTDHLLTIDINPFKVEKHTFVKRPQCPTCGDPDLISKRLQQPLELKSQPKQFTIDGGHRVMSPEETVAQYEHHVSMQSGIIGLLEPIHDGEVGELIHSYSAGICVRSNPRTVNQLKHKMRGGEAGGKGASRIQAKASGLCEAIERYSASLQGDEYTILASYNSLGEKAIHPNKCMNYSDSQYENADWWNNKVRSSHITWVPPRFDESAEVEWTPVWSLTEQTMKYLPTMYCYYDGNRIPDTPLYAPADSNGNAAGNTIEEAILQGFMEVVERDSIGTWWYNRVQRPGVDIESFNNPYLNKVKAYYASINRDLWVIDITNDLNIPVFAGISRRRDGSREDIIYGFGAHFDPHIALLRAVTEVSQSLSIFLVQDGFFAMPSFNDKARDWWEEATLDNQPYLAPLASAPFRTPSDYSRQWHDDIYDDVMRCVDIVGQKGMETLVLDQTQPDVGLNVVKVFVPGLCHDWRRLGSRRLYEVPVQMGWLDTPLREEELNPYTIYL